MQSLLKYPIYALLLMAIGCQQLGIESPKSFDEKLAYAYGTNTAVREASTTALNAGKITSADMVHVMTINDQARGLLDGAKLAKEAGDMGSANSRLLLATSVLTQIQTYLNSRK